jgi:hypothetical protein
MFISFIHLQTSLVGYWQYALRINLFHIFKNLIGVSKMFIVYNSFWSLYDTFTGQDQNVSFIYNGEIFSYE